jgi:hypothetical protein
VTLQQFTDQSSVITGPWRDYTRTLSVKYHLGIILTGM